MVAGNRLGVEQAAENAFLHALCHRPEQGGDGIIVEQGHGPVSYTHLVRYLKGVGPKTAERFEKLGIVTLADLLCHYPRRYIDFSKPYSIAEAPADTETLQLYPNDSMMTLLPLSLIHI